MESSPIPLTNWAPIDEDSETDSLQIAPEMLTYRRNDQHLMNYRDYHRSGLLLTKGLSE